MKEKVQTLQSLLGKLSKSDAAFASDLISSFFSYKKLTEKQALWVGKLIERANSPKPEVKKVDVGGFQGVVALFETAKAHLKNPKIVLSCLGKPVILYVSGPNSKDPGSIAIIGEGKYPERPWYGRVSPSGQWEPSLSTKEEMKVALTDLLSKFAANPARVAKEYGKLTGNCCFCNAALSDKRSIAAGFGPVCAAHYGLTVQWKEAVKKAEEQADVMAEVPVIEAPPVPVCNICMKNIATTILEGVGVCFACNESLTGALTE
jgi:hypothetical protein